MRPIGAIPTAGANTSALGCVMGVSMTPGQTALTLMRSFEYYVGIVSICVVVMEGVRGEWLTSIASHLVMFITAALEPQ
jgi:hypothetical protein